ncbi:hypothetical protein [Leifsonia sp. Leaf264]|uniref:hypothetical protein n=1 Tax=Leifsonia sp. Leaf264 TaxID=1736314 RepID=UPI0006FDDAC4|nr:hypothetical protein [Leifsonia sp. Leaf264]KQO98572.1 hypothetical protein ASF30_10955 [Leifsonia sp. Leaf264]
MTADWKPITYPPLNGAMDLSTADWQEWRSSRRCRDCGRQGAPGLDSRGGTNTAGGGTAYGVCDDCSPLDGCDERSARHPEDIQPGTKLSHWGDRVTDTEHDRLLALQATRRTNYLNTTEGTN